DGFFPVGLCEEDLVWPVWLTTDRSAAQPGEEAGVVGEAAGGAVVGVAPFGPVHDDDAGSQCTDVPGDGPACLGRVRERCVGQPGVGAGGESEDGGGALGLGPPPGGVAPGPTLTAGKVEDTRAVALIRGTDQGAATEEFGVVGVGHDGQKVD